MGQLRDKMERDMLLKNLSDRTRKTYLAGSITSLLMVFVVLKDKKV